MKEILEALIKDISKKSELEASYYKGAIEGIQLALAKLVEVESSKEKDTSGKSNKSKSVPTTKE